MVEHFYRMTAYQMGRAVRRAKLRHAAVEPHARILVPIKVPGEVARSWCVGWGEIGGPMEIASTANPFDIHEQFRLYEWLLDRVESYFAECRSEARAPQLVVSSRSAAEHVIEVARNLRGFYHSPIRRLGLLLGYVEERSAEPGQEAFHAATTLLTRHYAPGQAISEDEHLGVLTAWIRPPQGQHGYEAALEAERLAMGSVPKLEYDNRVLRPLFESYDEARQQGMAQVTVDLRAKRIEAAVLDVARPIYDKIQEALALLQSWSRVASRVEVRQHQEAKAFMRFMHGLDNGYGVAERDSPAASAYRYAGREVALENEEVAMLEDDHALAAAIIAGEAVEATICEVIDVRRFVAETRQSSLRLRPGDEVYLLSDPRLCVRVETVVGAGPTMISLCTIKGMRKPGRPHLGARIHLVPGVAVENPLARTFGTLKRRLSDETWTGSSELPDPNPRQAPRPLDPLQVLDALCPMPVSATPADHADDAVREALIILHDRDPLVLIDSPPGAGKTWLVERLAAMTVLEYQERCALATTTNAQAFDLARRAAKSFLRLPVVLVAKKALSIPPDLLSLPNVRVVHSPDDVPGGPLVAVSNAEKWSYRRSGPADFDLLILDEAYQLTRLAFDKVAGLAPRYVLVGDPGQIAPVARCNVRRWATDPEGPHVACPDALAHRFPGLRRIQLPVSRRLVPDTTAILQPAFYPDHPFEALTMPGERAIRAYGLRSHAPDRVISSMVGGGSLVALELPERDVGEVDDEIVSAIADLCERLTGGHVAVEDEQGVRMLRPERVGVVCAHVSQVGAVRRQLARKADGILVETANRYQGLERDVIVAWHPLSGRSLVSPFHIEAGRLCVALSRHRTTCIVVARAGISRRLERYVPKADRPLGSKRDDEHEGWRAHQMFWNKVHDEGRVVVA